MLTAEARPSVMSSASVRSLRSLCTLLMPLPPKPIAARGSPRSGELTAGSPCSTSRLFERLSSYFRWRTCCRRVCTSSLRSAISCS